MSGADPRTQARLEKLAEAWGLSYQIMDDFKDNMLNATQTGKTAARDSLLNRPNLPNAMGSDRAMDSLLEWMNTAEDLVSTVASTTVGWRLLAGLQAVLDREKTELMWRIPVAASA